MGLRVYRKRTVLRVSRVALPGVSFKIDGKTEKGPTRIRWGIFAGRELLSFRSMKLLAVDEACGIARNLWEVHRVPAQVVIHATNGRIQSERTYPDRTLRRKG